MNKKPYQPCATETWIFKNTPWAARYDGPNHMLIQYDGRIDFHLHLFTHKISRLDNNSEAEELNRFEYFILRSLVIYGGSIPKNELMTNIAIISG